MLAAETYYTNTNSTIAALVIVAICIIGLVIWPHLPRRKPRPVARDEYTRFPVRALVTGDMVDLSGDPYADPDHDENDLMAFEHFQVETLQYETPECIVVHFNNGSYGFPPDHKLRVLRVKCQDHSVAGTRNR